MKVSVAIVLIGFIALCNAFSQPIIPNTREEGCFDGQCAEHCAWDGVKLLKHDNLNQPGKCRLLKCDEKFNILITPCPFDMTGKHEWVDKDNSKLYPECCGRKVLKH
jgi:Single domain von Willebrand factor type C